MTTYRIFISSPADLAPERVLAEAVIRRVDTSLHGIRFEVFGSENIAYHAHTGPQEQIPLSSDFHLVVCLLWKRIGTELLPERFDATEADGRKRKRTGTEFEFETACEAARQNSRGGKPLPGVFLYRKSEDVSFSERHFEEERAQRQAVLAFFERWVRDIDGHYLGYAKAFATPAEFAREFERNLRFWLEQQREKIEWDIALSDSPFLGLQAFDRKHAEIYFGRDQAILQARARLRKAEADGFPVLWIVGASGSGKSSLLRAGLIPAMEERLAVSDEADFLQAVRTVVFKPSELGSDPFLGLAVLLIDVLPELKLGSYTTSEALAAILREPSAAVQQPLFRTALNVWAAAERKRFNLSPEEQIITKLLIAIDQAEEWLSLRSEAERRQFATLALNLVKGGRVLLAFSFRSDFYAELQRDLALRDLKQGAQHYDLPPPTPVEIAEMIEGPCRAAELTLEATEEHSLLIEICSDCQGTNSLPMLQFALTELFDRANLRSDRMLRIKDYEDINRAAGALSHAAEKVISLLPISVREEFPNLLRKLVRVDANAITAKAFELERFAQKPQFLSLIDALIGARLLTTADVGAQTQVRVVHESLFVQWPRAAAQIKQESRRLDAKRRLEEAFSLWREQRKPLKRLLHGVQLEEGLDLRKIWPLEAELEDYIGKSSREANAKRSVVALVFAVIAGVALLATWASHVSQQRAEKGLQLSAERALGRAREALLAGDESVYAAYLAESLSYMPEIASDEAAMALQQMPSTRLHQVAVHAGSVNTVAFSTNGSRVVTASDDRTAQLWDVRTGAKVGEPMLHQGEVNAAAFSPDGSRVATASGYTESSGTNGGVAQLWDAQTGNAIGAAMKHGGAVVAVGFSPDGSFAVTASRDRTARLWNAHTGVPVGEPMKHNAMVNSASFSPDGTRVVTASWDHTAQLWDGHSGASIHNPMVHDYAVISAAFSPDGTKVVTSSVNYFANKGDVRTWDGLTGASLNMQILHNAVVNAATFSPDGTQIVTAGNDNTARMWDAQTGAAKGVPMHHDQKVNAAVFSPDGRRVVTTSDDHTARVWTAKTGAQLGAQLQHKAAVAFAATSADGTQVATASGDNTARFWNTHSIKPLGAPMRHEAAIRSAAISPDGKRVVTASFDRTAKLWDAHLGILLGRPMPHHDAVWSVAFSSDGTRVISVSSNSAQLWDGYTGASLGEPMRHDSQIQFAAISSDGKWVVTGSLDHTSQLWDVLTSAKTGATMRHDASVTFAAFSPDGSQVVTASEDRTARLWDALTGIMLNIPMQHPDIVELAIFSPNGRQVLTASENYAQLWDAKTSAKLGISMPHNCRVQSAAFSPNGSRVMTSCSDNVVRQWDALTGAEIGKHMPGASKLKSATFSPRGNRLVIATTVENIHANNGGAQIWDAMTSDMLGAPITHARGVDFGVFSPDDTKVLTASLDGTARLWDAQTGAALGSKTTATELAALAGREVTDNGQIQWYSGPDWLRRINEVNAALQADNKSHILRWHFSDGRTRSISPFSKITVPIHIEREIDWTLAHPQRDEKYLWNYSPKILDEAYNLDPGHPLILLALSVFEPRPETKALWKRLSFPRFEKDPRLAARAAEILMIDKDPDNAGKAANIALALPNASDADKAKARAVLQQIAGGSR